MKKIILLILLIGCFTSCSKEEEKPPLKGEDKPLEIKKGHGGLFFGATTLKTYHLVATNKQTGDSWSAETYGAPSVKSPVGCVLKNPRIAHLILPVGEYELEISDRPQTSESRFSDVKIEEGKCVAVNAAGFAW